MSEEQNGKEMGAAINPRDLPAGYRFHPTGEELVNHYLKRRVLGYVDHPCIIPDVDICGCDPWELPEKFHGESIVGPDDQVQEWWFFSPHTPDTARKVKRSTPSGYWKKTGDDKEVRAKKTGTVIGKKKFLVFHEGRGKNGVKTNWVIHEYHLLGNDLNRTHVLCHLKHERDEKADNSTIESEREATNLADFEYALHQPDREDLFPEALVQAQMNSLMELIQPKNRVEFMADHQQQLQPARRSQNNCFPSNIHQLTNIEGPSVMDLSLDNILSDESIQLMLGTSEEDEDLADMQNSDGAYACLLQQRHANRGLVNQSYSPGFGVEAHDRRTRQSLLEAERTTYASVPRSLPVPDRNIRARAMHGYPLNVNLL